MRDPIEALKTLDVEVTMSTVSSGEVRRQGDVRRRRQRIAIGVGVFLVAGVALVPLSCLLPDDDVRPGIPVVVRPSESPEPVTPTPTVSPASPTPSGTEASTPTPSETPGGSAGLTTLPDDLDLAQGYVAEAGFQVNSPTASGFAPAIDLCGEHAWPAEGIDRLAASREGPESLDARELVLFATPQDAQRAFAALASAGAGCSSMVDDTGITLAVGSRQVSTAGGTPSVAVWVAETQGQPSGVVYVATVSGQAVLVVSSSGPYTEESANAAVRDVASESRDLLTGPLCSLTPGNC